MAVTKESIMSAKSISILDRVSRPKLWTGAVIAALVVVFLSFDAVTKVIQIDAVKEASAQLGLPGYVTPAIGVVLLICTAIYVIPPTRMLGAILLTGYLGGAIAIHVRAENGAFPVIFAATFAVLVWVALVLREPRLLSLILLRQWPGDPVRDQE
jgi:hypothetical protein